MSFSNSYCTNERERENWLVVVRSEAHEHIKPILGKVGLVIVYELRAFLFSFSYQDGALEAGFHKDQVLGCQVHDQGNKRRAEHGHRTADAHHFLLVHSIYA